MYVIVELRIQLCSSSLHLRFQGSSSGHQVLTASTLTLLASCWYLDIYVFKFITIFNSKIFIFRVVCACVEVKGVSFLLHHEIATLASLGFHSLLFVFLDSVAKLV